MRIKSGSSLCLYGRTFARYMSLPRHLLKGLSQRAIIYRNNGDPKQVLSVTTLPDLPPPPPHSLNLRFVLAPINPSDINVVQGVYPSKPSARSNDTHGTYYVPGNEGLAIVHQLGSSVQGFNKGDWVLMRKQQIGSWSSSATVHHDDVMLVPRKHSQNDSKLTEAHAAMLNVNPPTAWGMLTGFVNLEPGDWIVQNGANSAVCLLPSSPEVYFTPALQRSAKQSSKSQNTRASTRSTL